MIFSIKKIMPTRRKPTKKTRRRRQPTRKTRKPHYRRRYLPLNGFPTTQTARHRYNTVISLNPSTGSIAKHTFIANGMFDPDSTGVGHQPRGYDEFAEIYNHYTVLGAKIVVRPVGPHVSQSNTDNLCKYGIILDDDGLTTGYTTYTDMAESRLAGGGRVVTKDLGTGKSFVKTFSTTKFFNIKNPVAQSQYQGSVTANPSETAAFVVWACSPVMADTDTYDFEVTIDFIAVWSEPKFLAESQIKNVLNFKQRELQAENRPPLAEGAG